MRSTIRKWQMSPKINFFTTSCWQLLHMMSVEQSRHESQNTLPLSLLLPSPIASQVKSSFALQTGPAIFFFPLGASQFFFVFFCLPIRLVILRFSFPVSWYFRRLEGGAMDVGLRTRGFRLGSGLSFKKVAFLLRWGALLENLSEGTWAEFSNSNGTLLAWIRTSLAQSSSRGQCGNLQKLLLPGAMVSINR